MRKYIIKNCERLANTNMNITGVHFTCGGIDFDTDEYILCQDCTDCRLKQVVEKCKNAGCKDMDCEYRSPKSCLQCGENIVGIFAQDILDLFEIEECE